MNSYPSPLLEARIREVRSPAGHLLLSGVELVQDEPGLLAVVGDTGSGKTTLLKTIAGLIPHVYPGLQVKAQVRISGQPPRTAVEQARVFLVPNPPGAHFLSNFVRQELALAGLDIGGDAGGLRGLLNKSVDHLSEGEKYRLLTFMALHHLGRRGVLLVDEPHSNLDDEGMKWLMGEAGRIQEEREVLVIVTGHTPPTMGPVKTLQLDPPRRATGSLREPPLPPPVKPDRVELRECAIGPPGHPPLVRGFSFSAHPGEAVAITGSNGSGKTTLLKTLAGILKCRGGQARMPRGPVRILPPPAYHLFTHSTVRGEIGEPARRWGLRREEVLEGLGLGSMASRDPYTLSTGEARLLLLTRLLLEAPSLLLLDEPFRGLDAPRRTVVAGMLREYRAKGGVVVAALLRPREAGGLFDRVYVLEGGGKGQT